MVFFLEWNNHLAENSTALPCVLCFFSISMPTVVVQLMGKHINSAAMLIWGRIAAHSSSSSSVESQQNYVGWENNTICWKNYHITMTSSKLWIYLESTLKKLSSHHQNSFQFWSILDLKEGYVCNFRNKYPYLKFLAKLWLFFGYFMAQKNRIFLQYQVPILRALWATYQMKCGFVLMLSKNRLLSYSK